MIKLCYKKYDWKISNGACRAFTEKTGEDLKGFFADYIVEYMKIPEGTTVFEKLEILRRVHSREDASFAFYVVIKAAQDGISLTEIEDATHRVGWVLSERPDDLSEPWPIEMLNLAFAVNDYLSKAIPKKKADISEE